MSTGLENLKIYQMAKSLELRIHKITEIFPFEEKYRSIDQLKRSSASVSNNIAESYYKNSLKEKIYILRNQVITENEETRSNILRCAEKGFLDQNIAELISEDYTQLRKATYGYIKFLRNKFARIDNSLTH
ncbi:MAG: S23 ribosomal protein [Parcubacteria group bacterium GW2011_GWC1_43_61]|nr:MAG: S23 ribosomal protein [Candidatus Azambacteria bacterium GW2011_GWF1_41_10]KKS49568.1 MAG: S23 ribosomal protein [Candidatus Azambacteria bacterium GW2011_GWF2_42_22]KKS68896.1 MAG: S23 ribosomal protein [Candidatus Azambacteria bacterium GW2011_GWA2_42_62]KKT03679.1 MAG: S23 ribosomal protein [Candidatus Azambacteria bacterium GW2011_GWD1_43_18]KKT12833.1 MAG: S23 ribosomal protein [Candidatus Azambacteria bacterium GW2011_GWC2_43_27]KKT16089.1 MAG: S23 ribosomal protein [Parcubacteri